MTAPTRNRGPYFCLEVARRASPDPFFMMQDADDWAARHRAEILLRRLLKDQSDLAVSSESQFCEGADGRAYQVATRWNRVANGETPDKFVVQRTFNNEFRYRVPHTGLIRSASLHDIGGYYGGFHVGWDTLLTNLVLMIGTISWTPEPLYYRLVRPDSLTHSSQTGLRSGYRAAVFRCLQQLYGECYAQYQLFRMGGITRVQLGDCMRQICGRYVAPHQRAALDLQVHRLREAMI